MMNCRFPHPDASYTLFCFPWAGGGSNFYSAWGEKISENVEVVGITLPGRESRFKEPCDYTVQSLVDEISAAIHEYCKRKPFAFWGHSLGALLAFEVALTMKQKYGSELEHLYVSGVSAPQSPMRKQNQPDVSKMTKEEFLQFLRRLGGTPPEILENPEMMKPYLPALRTDYSLLDQFTYELPEGDPPLSCHVSFFDGDKDKEHDVYAWKQLTSGPFRVKKLPGGHFYLKDINNIQTLQKIISLDLSELNEIL
ncbi:S-acyl fatty acid synthase thioesterase, medium chain-like [Gigantopelta aegis]|uniref:S-acyl fatty acid synthase thioesterase, medium chain-like n=1 Tax=Gigantopelta aegis TaxID=1735272 RepID=UPI001B88787D|nr:S-acyl fatty acid synthase thioesterase, medium chain-like [Gigantopelta aegis]